MCSYLACDLSLITRLSLFSDNNISRGSEATFVKCGEIFNGNFIANSLLSLPVKEFWQEAQLSLRDRATRTCQLKSCKVLHKCRRLAFEKLWNWWMTFKVIQGHWRLCHLIGHIWFPISLEVYLYLVRFFRYQHLFAKILNGHVTLTMPTWGTALLPKG